ncbi:MAG: DUF1501 domain-containing protein [Planctomycetota bacterium]|nr:DUF1501 domain-containing protein [Planctomycetota bacterium]
MLSIHDRPYRLCDSVSRREAMRIGGIGALGLSLSQLIDSRTAHAARDKTARRGKAKSVILFWLSGGPPQHDTWDPKPDAPEEIRGEFGVIASATPGLMVGELMPQTARLTDRMAVLRAVVSYDNSHSSSGYQMLTGVPHVPLSRENATAQAPNLWPSLGAIVRSLRADRGGLPAAITLPRHIANVGEILWPGQDAGILGRKYDPWLLTCDPSQKDFHLPGLDFPEGLSPLRFSDRRSLLQQLDETTRQLERQYNVRQFGDHSQQAIDLLAGGSARQAFDLNKESEAMRDRYGRSKFGQSVLLARRLVEAGVSLVQVNWQQLEGKENYGSWDTHKKHGESLKGWLMPMMDQSYSALIEDLEQRGMLDDTLVAWVGEFGHTPKFNKDAGRDHWGSCFSVALAGAGIQGGVVHGQSDKHAAFPLEGQVAPRDIAATIFHCLGYEPETQIFDQSDRPLAISQGHAIWPILS